MNDDKLGVFLEFFNSNDSLENIQFIFQRVVEIHSYILFTIFFKHKWSTESFINYIHAHDIK